MAQCVSNRCKDLFKRKKYFGVMGTLIPCSLHLAVSRALTCTFQTEVIKKLSRNRWLSFIVVQWWQVDKICILYDCKSLTPDRRLLKKTLRALLNGIVIWDGSLWTSQLVAFWRLESELVSVICWHQINCWSSRSKHKPVDYFSVEIFTKMWHWDDDDLIGKSFELKVL